MVWTILSKQQHNFAIIAGGGFDGVYKHERTHQLCDAVLAPLDVKDPVLTVKQQERIMVRVKVIGVLTRCITSENLPPSQRNGSLLWYQDTTTLLKDRMGMVDHEPYPDVLRAKDNCCASMLHVDDLFICGKSVVVMNEVERSCVSAM